MMLRFLFMVNDLTALACRRFLIAAWGCALVFVAAIAAHGDEFVLLKNGNVISGEVFEVGPTVIIRRGPGNEMKLRANDVCAVADSMAQLYRLRREQSESDGIRSLHADARWCLRMGLFQEMEETLDAADAIDPTHPETLRLRRQLVAAGEVRNTLPIGEAGMPSSAAPVAGSPGPRESVDPEDYAAHSEFSGPAVAFFTGRVQPVLVSRCGNVGCHRSPTASDWQLTHLGNHLRPSARMTRLNFAAALRQIDREDAERSPLLLYAVQAHGGRRDAPLGRTDEGAFESLRQWAVGMSENDVEQDAASLARRDRSRHPGGFGGDAGAVMKAAFVAESPSLDPGLSPPDDLGAMSPPPPIAGLGADSGPGRAGSEVQRGSGLGERDRGPVRLPPIRDPFDPSIFNRLYRGENAPLP